MRFTFTKTNGQIVVVAVTNQAPGDSAALAANCTTRSTRIPLCRVVTVLWPGIDVVNQYGTFIFTAFNLYARSPGYQAAAIRSPLRYRQ